MGNASFNQDWYGMQAKVLAQSDDRVVVDYGCKGRGIVKNYNLFEGIQLCFLDFESDESMETQKFNPDIIQITHCQTGRYECEFANHTVSYLPEGYFSVATTEHLPVSFSFPLGKYYGVSLVIDRQALSNGTRRMMQTIPIDLDKIGTTLGLETRWYVSDTPAQLKHLFSELYSAAETEPIGYFKIKAIELLYHMDQLTQINGCDLKYFDKKQIQTTKAIREYLISHLDEKVSLEQLAKEAHLNLSVFHLVFSHIYGDTPYAYLKKYKMNLAAQWLSEDKMKIGDIALELGYSNASKFANLSIFTLFIRVMIPVVLFASTFIATTKVSELIAAMYSLKIPRSITITFAMVLRFFPTFSEEIHNIYDAMKLRGIALSWKNVFTRPVLILEAIAIPIVMRSASIAEELSASAVTRGIDNPAQRTSFIQLKVHAKDWMVLCFFLIAFVVLFFCKYQIYGRI